MAREAGVQKPVWQAPEHYPAELYAKVKQDLWDRLWSALHTGEKMARKAAVDGLIDAYVGDLPEDNDELPKQVKTAIHDLVRRSSGSR